MLTLVNKSDKIKIESLDDSKIQQNISNELDGLAENYGDNRKIEDDGGFVVLMEEGETIETVLSKIDKGFKLEEAEIVEEEDTFFVGYFACNNEYLVSVYFPKHLLSREDRVALEEVSAFECDDCDDCSDDTEPTTDPF